MKMYGLVSSIDNDDDVREPVGLMTSWRCFSRDGGRKVEIFSASLFACVRAYVSPRRAPVLFALARGESQNGKRPMQLSNYWQLCGLGDVLTVIIPGRMAPAGAAAAPSPCGPRGPRSWRRRTRSNKKRRRRLARIYVNDYIKYNTRFSLPWTALGSGETAPATESDRLGDRILLIGVLTALSAQVGYIVPLLQLKS